MSRKLFLLFVFCFASITFAAERYLATNGVDTGSCLSSTQPCATVQYVVDRSISNDVVHVAAGVYNNPLEIIISKTLTIRGAQAGIDARTRTGAESVLSVVKGITVSGSSVVFDGLTLQDAGIGVRIRYALAFVRGVTGSKVINNKFTNNITAIAFANLYNKQALIEHNLFSNNNLPGPLSGTAIYVDQFVSGATGNVVVNENHFVDNKNAAIFLNNEFLSEPTNNFNITNNTITGSSVGLYLNNVSSSTIYGNTITNVTDPIRSGQKSSAIFARGAVNHVTISYNTLRGGNQYGVFITSESEESPTPINYNLVVQQNNISSFKEAGMNVDVVPVGPLSTATCNYWGKSSGPHHSVINPTGLGDVVEGEVVAEYIKPWLTSASPNAVCNDGMPTIQKSFSPSTITYGKPTVVSIVLGNSSSTNAHLTSALTDVLPSGLVVSGAPSNTCGGTVSAPTGSATIKLTNGVIPANGSCTIRVSVRATLAGTFKNTIAVQALKTDRGNNSAEARATLTVIPAH